MEILTSPSSEELEYNQTNSLVTKILPTSSTESEITKLLARLDSLQTTSSDESRFVRYSFYPIRDEEAYTFFVRQEAAHWSDSEFDFRQDLGDYEAASPAVKHLIDSIMAFFIVGDGPITRNIIQRFLLGANVEEQAFLVSQLHIEQVHAVTYGLIAVTLKRDNESEIHNLMRTTEECPFILKKLKFMEYYTLADVPTYLRWVAYSCVEGIIFCGLFPSILYFLPLGKFINLCQANHLIRIDETLHSEFGALMVVREVNRILSLAEDVDKVRSEINSNINSMVEYVVGICCDFVDYYLPEDIGALTNKGMKEYQRLMANRILIQFQLPPTYLATNHFSFMEASALEVKTNFHERRVVSYTKNSVSDMINWRKRAGLVESQSTQAFTKPEDVDF